MTLHYKFLKVWTHSAMIYVQKYRGLQLVMPCTVCKSWWCAFISTKPGKLPPRLSLDSSSLEGDISSKVPPALAFLLQPGPDQLIHPKQSPTSRQSPRLPSNLPLLALLCQRQISSTAQPSRHKYAVQTLGDPWLIIIVDRPPFFRISNHLRRCIFVVGLVGEQLQVLSLNQTNSLLIAQLHLEVMAH